MKERELKRISLFIGEDQYRVINERGLNLSWLVRDLIDDFINEQRVILNVSEETLKIYNQIISNLGPLGSDFEGFFRESLHSYLKHKIESMKELEKLTAKKSEGSKK